MSDALLLSVIDLNCHSPLGLQLLKVYTMCTQSKISTWLLCQSTYVFSSIIYRTVAQMSILRGTQVQNTSSIISPNIVVVVVVVVAVVLSSVLLLSWDNYLFDHCRWRFTEPLTT